MRTLQRKLKRFKRKRKHLRYLQNSIWTLKYEILNDALILEINETKINLFHKYQKRYKLITFMRR
jgi:hypothetical protein